MLRSNPVGACPGGARFPSPKGNVIKVRSDPARRTRVNLCVADQQPAERLEPGFQPFPLRKRPGDREAAEREREVEEGTRVGRRWCISGAPRRGTKQVWGRLVMRSAHWETCPGCGVVAARRNRPTPVSASQSSAGVAGGV